MPHSHKVIYSLLITLVFALPFSLLTTHYYLLPIQPAVLSDQNRKTLPPETKTIDVVARVGGYLIGSLSGWTSAYAEVTLSSQGLTRKTTADNRGYFIFYSLPVPDDPKELCLAADDVQQLSSFPVCLAPPPRNRNIQITDVLLSPTISIETSKIPSGKTAKASGMTFPGSKVNVYLFTERNLSFWAKITQSIPFFSLLTSHFSPSIAHAANFPIYETKSNENGYFEFSLPANFPSNNRLFVSSVFSPPPLLTPDSQLATQLHPEYNSPKSNTLYFQVIGLWELFKRFLQTLFDQARFLLPNWPNWKDPLFIILIEILVLFGIIGAILTRKSIEKGKRGYWKTTVTV